MKKIGFIDYYLDEWHANNYPQWISEATNGEMQVTYAYGQIDSPLTGMTSEEWCQKNGITRCLTEEELVEKSDYLIVLSPDNCEMHEPLCQVPLCSGKPTYVDKTFAPDYDTARRIFALADAHHTPCYSTSALRFAAEYQDIDTAGITAVSSWGPYGFETYSIHQLEPLVMLMKAPAKRVMYIPAENWYTLIIAFADGRHATVTGHVDTAPFMMSIATTSGNKTVKIESAYFQEFIRHMCRFFETGVVEVPHEETLTIMAVRSTVLEAQNKPCTWVDVACS